MILTIHRDGSAALAGQVPEIGKKGIDWKIVPDSVQRDPATSARPSRDEFQVGPSISIRNAVALLGDGGECFSTFRVAS